MIGSRHIGNVLIIIIKCMTLRDDILAIKNNKFLNLEIEGDLKIVIDCYNKKSNIPRSIILLMDDIWKLSYDLYIYDCHHIYKEINRIIDCLAKKSIYNLESIIWWSNFLYDVRKFNFKYYCDSSFSHIYRYSILQTPFIQKKNP